MRHHRNKFKAKTDLPIYRHPLTHNANFSIYKLTIIDKQDNTSIRKSKEMDWIIKLKTKIPFGLNIIAKPKSTITNTI